MDGVEKLDRPSFNDEDRSGRVSDDDVETDEKPHYPAWQWVLTLISLYLGAILYGLDTTIAADVQTAAYETFGDIENLAWIGLGFPMASVSCILLVGRVYGLFNIKTLTNTSVVLFEVGSALCGAAPNMNALIVGRVIAGLGGCGMYLGALTYISALGSPDKLVLYNALTGVCWGVGAILGPVVGGAFSVSSATWRWAFYINLPLAGLVAPVYIFVTPSFDPRPDLSFKQKMQAVDWAGALLIAVVPVVLITTIAFAGATFSWDSGTSIALWTVFGVALVLLVLQQYFTVLTTPEKRIFPIHFLKSRTLVLLYIATAASATANAVAIYYIPLFFAFTRGDSALDAAVRLLPYIVVFIFCVLLAGGSLPLSGRYSLYYIIGGVFMTVGSALMFTVRADTSAGRVYAYEALVAVGSGLTFQNAYAVASVRVALEDRSNAIGFINTAQIGATALALAIASCLYQNLGVEFLRDAPGQYGLPDSFYEAALGGVGSDVLGSAPAAATVQVISTVAYTIARVFGTAVAAGAVLLVAALLMRHEKVDLTGAAAGG